MYTVIYQWEIQTGKYDDFVCAWEAVTEHYSQHYNALGARLHKVNENHFVAYAQWPTKEARDLAFSLDDAPQQAAEIMQDSIIHIHPAIEMEMLSDKLLIV